MTDGWIVIPNWDKFQHYSDRRQPWLKDYTNQLDRDEYLELTPTARALLQDLRRLYLLSGGLVRRDAVAARVRMRVTRQHFQQLSDAGFIEIVASKPLALARARARSREEDEDKDNPLPPSEKGDKDFSNDLKPGRRKPTAKQLRRYTGCSYRRGTHGSTYVHEVLGTAKPPPDWPHPPPEPDEILLHLEIEDR